MSGGFWQRGGWRQPDRSSTGMRVRWTRIGRAWIKQEHARDLSELHRGWRTVALRVGRWHIVVTQAKRP